MNKIKIESKKILLFLLITMSTHFSHAQNVGIGTAEPLNKLQVTGNFLVHAPTQGTATAPTAAQIKTMVNGGSIIFGGDSTGIIYDPGGPAGNYSPNVSSNVMITSVLDVVGIELTVATMQLGIGDSLIVKQSSSATNYLLAVGNGYTSTGKFFFNSQRLYIIFKSNGDASVGSGFTIQFRRLYDNSALLPEVTGMVGKALLFDAKSGSLVAGRIGNGTRGNFSVALGESATASGQGSVAIGGSGVKASGSYAAAIGQEAEAVGIASVAIGRMNVANGQSSIAIGELSTANGRQSTAIGSACIANGFASFSMGSGSIATGNYSVAMGNATNASGVFATSMGVNTTASGNGSTAMGQNTISRGYAGTALGMFNYPIIALAQTTASPTTPLFIVGNGDNENNLNNAMAVLKNGNVGIGTRLPPVTKLQVLGGSDASLTDNSGYFVLGDVNSINLVMDNNEIIARNNGANTTLFLQNEGGDLQTGGSASKPGGGSWSATSDARLKQHLYPYSDGLQQLQQINPVYFNYNQQSGYDTSKQFIGVLAQELKEVAPYMVSSFKKDDTDYLNVDNTAMTYMLINAVKEQQKEMEAQQKELKELQNEINEWKGLLKKWISNNSEK